MYAAYLKECPAGPAGPPKVDCAFMSEVQKNVYDNPVDNLEDYLIQVNTKAQATIRWQICFRS